MNKIDLFKEARKNYCRNIGRSDCVPAAVKNIFKFYGLENKVKYRDFRSFGFSIGGVKASETINFFERCGIKLRSIKSIDKTLEKGKPVVAETKDHTYLIISKATDINVNQFESSKITLEHDKYRRYQTFYLTANAAHKIFLPGEFRIGNTSLCIASQYTILNETVRYFEITDIELLWPKSSIFKLKSIDDLKQELCASKKNEMKFVDKCAIELILIYKDGEKVYRDYLNHCLSIRSNNGFYATFRAMVVSYNEFLEYTRRNKVDCLYEAELCRAHNYFKASLWHMIKFNYVLIRIIAKANKTNVFRKLFMFNVFTSTIKYIIFICFHLSSWLHYKKAYLPSLLSFWYEGKDKVSTPYVESLKFIDHEIHLAAAAKKGAGLEKKQP
jgi:hypothetical protein